MHDWWADVPAARVLPVARRATERAQLVALVARPARSRAGRPLVLAAGGLALASATGAAFAFFGSDQPTDRTTIECHTTVEAARGVSFAGAGVSLEGALELDPQDRQVQIDRAVDLCAELWANGALRMGALVAVGPNPPGEVEEVPPLTACVTPEGVAAVFPTELDVCESLGMTGLGQ